jgi:Virulence protein RhuM family
LARTASDGKKYKTKLYNLDAILSVGYRVNSLQATQFRIWATEVLKKHLVHGYTLNEKRLSERGVGELQQAVELLQKTLVHHDLVNDIGQEAIQLISSYSKSMYSTCFKVPCNVDMCMVSSPPRLLHGAPPQVGSSNGAIKLLGFSLSVSTVSSFMPV